MPDMQNYSVVAGGSKSVAVPQYTISGQLTDSRTGAVLADFTGANALQFPAVLGSLTPAQRDQLVATFAQYLLLLKAGLV